jgi:hypothetical protein
VNAELRHHLRAKNKAEAHTRIKAARLTQVSPEASNLIQSCEMSLSVAATTQSHFRKENLRRKEQGKSSLTLEEKREVLDLVSGSTRREAEQNLNIHFAQTRVKNLSFQSEPELLEKITMLMDFMAHKNFDRDLAKRVELLVDQELSKYEKLKTPKDHLIPLVQGSIHRQNLRKRSWCSDRSEYIFDERAYKKAPYTARQARADIISKSSGRMSCRAIFPK